MAIIIVFTLLNYPEPTLFNFITRKQMSAIDCLQMYYAD